MSRVPAPLRYRSCSCASGSRGGDCNGAEGEPGADGRDANRYKGDRTRTDADPSLSFNSMADAMGEFGKYGLKLDPGRNSAAAGRRAFRRS